MDGIWFFDPENQSNNLILRVEKKINKILWYSGLNHIIFSCDSEIIIAELDGKNEIKIAEGKNPELVSEKELLYLDQNNVLKILQIRE